MIGGSKGAAIALVALLGAQGEALAEAPRGSSPHVDPDARWEARSELPAVSADAIAHYLQARRAERAGDLRGAASELSAAVAFDEESAELRTALADALARSGQPAQAEVEAKRAVELSSGLGLAASQGHVVLAKLAAVARNPDLATREFRLAIDAQASLAAEGKPIDPEPWRLLALLQLERGDEPGAFGTLEELAVRAPGEGAGFREAGRWLVSRGQAGRAERYLRRAAGAVRGDLGAWRLLSRAHLTLHRLPEVEEDLRAILDLDPEDQEALEELGEMALKAGNPVEARPWLERYLRAAREPAVAAAQVSGEWLAAGRPEEALACVRAARAEIGSDPRLLLAEGLALRRLRRMAGAVRVLSRVGVEDGAYPEARAALSDVLARMGRGAEALRVLEAPLRLAPGDARLVTARASVLVRIGQPRKAQEVLEAAVEHAPRSAPLRLALARAERVARANGRAEAELRALLALSPSQGEDVPELNDALAELSTLRAEGGEISEASSLAHQAVELSPRSPLALAALGRVLLLQGDPKGAVEVLLQASELSGGEALVLDALGDAYRASGRRVYAAAAWRRAFLAAGAEGPHDAERLRAALSRKLRKTQAFLDPREPHR
jgi:tetratricopeptide (TPR) repeat protein